MKSTITETEVIVTTTQKVPVINLEISIKEAWVMYALTQKIGGPPERTARGIFSGMSDSLSTALNSILAEHYEVHNDTIRSAIYNYADNFKMSASVQCNDVNIDAVINKIEASFNE